MSDSVTIRPKYAVEEIPKEDVPKRQIILLGREKYEDMAGKERYRYTRTVKEVEDKERHFMVYNLKGSSLLVRGEQELRRLGYSLSGSIPLIEEDPISGESREINLGTLAKAQTSVKNQQKALRRAAAEANA